eukprot:1006185-Prymnesium_polylepis.1
MRRDGALSERMRGAGCVHRLRTALDPQVSTPSTAHKHSTHTCTHIGGAHGIRSDVLSAAPSRINLRLWTAWRRSTLPGRDPGTHAQLATTPGRYGLGLPLRRR